jgi:hypothetical protein
MISQEVRDIITPIIQKDVPSPRVQLVIEKLLGSPPIARVLYEAACAVERNQLSDLIGQIETVMQAFPVITRELI